MRRVSALVDTQVSSRLVDELEPWLAKPTGRPATGLVTDGTRVGGLGVDIENTHRLLDGLRRVISASLRPFAEWHVIRDARRRAAHHRYAEGTAAGDRTDTRTAIVFLRWLDSIPTTVDTLTQE